MMSDFDMQRKFFLASLGGSSDNFGPQSHKIKPFQIITENNLNQSHPVICWHSPLEL